MKEPPVSKAGGPSNSSNKGNEMRRTISTILLAFGLLFSAVPAFADQGDPNGTPPPVLCGDANNPDSQPCSPPACDDNQAGGEPCTPSCHVALNDLWRQVFAIQGTVEAQRTTITRQHARILRLKARLAAK